MSNLERYNDTTKMQLKILDVLREYYKHYGKDGVDTTMLLDDLVKRHGLGKREWQCSLKNLGEKGYVSYGSGVESCDGGVLWKEKAIKCFED